MPRQKHAGLFDHHTEKSMIKTILYDLDGTLRFNQPSGREFFLDHALTLGVTISPEDRRRTAIWEHHYWAESPQVLHDVSAFTDPEEFWVNYSQRQLEAAGIAAKQAQSLAPLFHLHMKSNYQPQDVILPETYDVLGQLREAGYILGVVSNRERSFGEYLIERGLAALVHFSISGGEAGSKKPDKGIFEFALRQAGVSADEALYVGDSYFADVIGARGAGIQPVLYDPAGVFDGWSPSEEPPGLASRAGASVFPARTVTKRSPVEARLAMVGPSPSTMVAPPLRANQVPVIRSHAELLTLLEGRGSWPGNGR
jgi:putative hydrolase of the HAD superfamily